jgi:2-polyprenyl-3-methyl-5-hydroxy-6-metoxy-1,4-benzoquinol methylase
LAMGVYQTESVACFCGSSNAQLVTDHDRYGFDHVMWLCRDCGVLYANPRMTEASYAQFYANEYRHIYDRPEDTAEQQFARSVRVATEFRDELDGTYGFHPAVVFDIGCNGGGWLMPFREAGADVYGVDYGAEHLHAGQDRDLSVQVGSLEALEQMAVKADLILLNHVLEHATDLGDMLRRVHRLLTPDGFLYVGLPGLFHFELDQLFQNAHPWQFTAETLAYVMGCCGFEEIRADHTIASLWRRSEVVREISERPASKHIRDIANYLYREGTRYVPQVRSFNKFPKVKRQAAIAQATARGLPEIRELLDRHSGFPAVVIGGGPSVDQYVDKIRTLQREGAILLSIERMYPWCQAHGLVPEYVVTQDASDDVLEAFTELRPGSTHLVATQCQAAVFERLKEQPVYFFHTATDIPLEDLHGPTAHGVLVNAGGSVALCSFSLAMLLGMQHVHLFGFDCHTTAGGYAAGIAGVGEQLDHLDIRIGGRAFVTTPAYIAFAQQFFDLYTQGRTDGLLQTVTVYGDSLVTAMCAEIPRGEL